MTRGLWGAAAVIGSLYWASRQPGGVKGTVNRLKECVNDVRNGADPMSAGRRFIKGDTGPARLTDPALQGSYETYNQ